MSTPANALELELRTADSHLRRRNPMAALHICKALIAAYPDAVEPHLIMARSEQMQNRFRLMYDSAQRAIALAPNHPQAVLMEIEALIAMGRIRDAKTKIQTCVSQGQSDPVFIARLAEMQTQIADHNGALDSLRLAEALFNSSQKEDAGFLYNLASAHIATGYLERAERILDRLIASHPHDYDAYYNRATLRKQTASENHLDDLYRALLSNPRHIMGQVQLRYALAKELEDLEDYKGSFKHLADGARLRRENMAYRVDDDIETMRLIAKTFDSDYAAKHHAGFDRASPIFIVGLPRSGTTLFDRILCSHPEIVSVGEINDLPHLITRLCGAAPGKAELIKASSQLDMAPLGEEYQDGLEQRIEAARHIVDKTPLNFLYIGLIVKALPNATIIHVRRNDMDVGYAMFKTLFRMGYPFSYDQLDIARYIHAKQGLMKHWNAVFPGRIHTFDYEDMIDNQEAESRRLIAATGLEWNESCLNFHNNISATATASAAQVRRPLYSSSVKKWKHYEKDLEPMLQELLALKEAAQI